jgi:hypothetical protein
MTRDERCSRRGCQTISRKKARYTSNENADAEHRAMDFSALILYLAGHGDDSDSLPALSGDREDRSFWHQSVGDRSVSL